MFYPHYAAIKQQLNTIKSLKNIAWYTEGATVHTTPAAYIELHNIRSGNVAQAGQQADLKVSVHLITTVLTKADGDIDDEMLERHSVIDCEIYDQLQGFGDCNLFDNLECTAYSNRPEHGAIHTVMLFTSEAAQLRNDTGAYADIEFPAFSIGK